MAKFAFTLPDGFEADPSSLKPGRIWIYKDRYSPAIGYIDSLGLGKGYKSVRPQPKGCIGEWSTQQDAVDCVILDYQGKPYKM